jgi:DNA-binding response OmpR family regulator
LGLVKFDPKEGKYGPFSVLLSEHLREKQSTPVRKQKGNGVSGIESALLDYLQRNMSRPSSFEELGREVWGERGNSGARDELLKRRIQVAVSRLRKKLLKAGTGEVVSVRDQGYRLVLSK